MKYLTLETCIEAFEENIKTTSDGFWGVLAFISSLETSRINPGSSYMFSYSKVGHILENWFSVKSEIKAPASSLTSYILFSKYWIDELISQLLPETKNGKYPNIYYVIAWFYQRKAFDRIFSHEELVDIFSKDTHLSIVQLKEIFDFSPKMLNFTDYQFTQSEKIDFLQRKFGVKKFDYNSIASDGKYRKAAPRELTRAAFTQTLYSGTNIQKCILITNVPVDEYYFSGIANQYENMSEPIQQIFFGAPGVGKSYHLKSVYKSDDDTVRITFHPETDYASFVGCYKPQTEGGDIVYKFQGQAFAEAYITAWKRFVSDTKERKDFFLVIEEINRGNCAQIFGDIFQLLDRNDQGFSVYTVRSDKDFALYLQEEFKVIADKLKELKPGLETGQILMLPPNLNILATMNTSDQSLFPIDSAFKRRWDWVYMPIETHPIDEKTGDSIIRCIETKEYIYDWGQFLEKVNERIFKTTESEDKQLGFWFVKPKYGNSTISVNYFVSKVIFFLWNDIYKDFGDDASSIFYFALDGNPESKEKRRHSFKDFTAGFQKVNESLVDAFIKNLEVTAHSKNNSERPLETPDYTSDANSN